MEAFRGHHRPTRIDHWLEMSKKELRQLSITMQCEQNPVRLVRWLGSGDKNPPRLRGNQAQFIHDQKRMVNGMVSNRLKYTESTNAVVSPSRSTVQVKGRN